MNPITGTPYPYTTFIKDILHYIRPYRRKFWFGSFIRLSGDFVYLYTTYALSNLIAAAGGYALGQSIDAAWFYLFAWAGTYAYVHSSRQVAKYLCYQVAEKMKLDTQTHAFYHLNLLDIAWHEKENSGNKLKRVQSGGEAMDKVGRMWVDRMIEIAVNSIGMMIIIAFVDGAVALIMGLFLVTYLCISFPLSRRASDAARAVNRHEEDFSGLAFEIVNNIRTIKVMGLFSALASRLDMIKQRTYAAILRRIRRFRFLSWTQAMWGHLFRIGIFAIIIVDIFHGRHDVAFLVLFNFYFTTLRTSVEELSQTWQDLIVARYQSARLKDILLEPIRIDDDHGKIDLPPHWKKITLRNVSFAYGKNTVLRHISFDINRGEKIGIVGLSGVGKSTLFKLLLKEYEDFSGDILFDDVSIRDIKKSSYFKRMSVVLQETEVFNFTLRDNIVLAGDAPLEKELAQTLAIAHVSDFAKKLPEGLDTLIGEKGVKLSGGEKQRVGIARAIVRHPDILFLDEATSHLDLESEEKIRDSLHQFFQEVTAVVIAHRLTTIQEMDRILLIENGRVVESGNFETLYKKKGRFFELWEMQRL